MQQTKERHISLSRDLSTSLCHETEKSTKQSTEGKTEEKQWKRSPIVDVTKGVLAKAIYQAGFSHASSEICGDCGRGVKVLIVIMSAPANQNARDAIRKTWGSFHARKDVSVGFMLGDILNATIKRRVEEEQKIYNDVIRGNSVDTFDNLTLKSISILEWVHTYCPNVTFVLKSNDDTFLNVARLLAYIAKLKPEQRAIYGQTAKRRIPDRSKDSMYYISERQYKNGKFPYFTTGPAYLFPAMLAEELYLASLNTTYIKLEDVFITGIVAESLGIPRVRARLMMNRRVPFLQFNVQFDISIHRVTSNEQYELWKKLNELPLRVKPEEKLLL